MQWAEVLSIARVDTLDILVNGKVVRAVGAPDTLHVVFDDAIPIPQGGWIAARVLVDELDGPAEDALALGVLREELARPLGLDAVLRVPARSPCWPEQTCHSNANL